MQFLIVLLLALLFGFPIWVFVRMGSMSDLISDLRSRINNLDSEVARLRKDLAEKTFVKQTAEKKVGEEASRRVESATPPITPAAPVTQQQTTPEPEPSIAQPPPIPAKPPFVPPISKLTPALPQIPAINWEQFMGVKLFAWIGGFALFIGVALFLKYSFEHNLIPPALRVAIGFLTGIGLVVGGFRLSRKEYAVTGQTLCATGVVILYAVTFACRAIYHFPFFGQIPTFLLMVLITAVAFLLAVRLNALVVAILGMLGGFLTPILLSTGQDNPFGLFGYIALLDVGLVAVALLRRWNFLALLGAVGTVFMQLGWVDKFFEVSKVFTGMTIFLSFSALYIAAYFSAEKRKQANRWFAAPAIMMPFVSLGFAFYLLKYSEFGTQPGLLFGFVFLADLLLLSLAYFKSKLFRVHIAAGATVFAILTAWTVGYLNNALLNWGLGFYLLFAVLHSVFPLVLQKLRPEIKPGWWAHLFPPIALALIMVPIVKIPEISFLVWPCILLLDLLAIGLAVLSASMLSIVAVLFLTLGATALWLLRVPAEVTSIPESVLLIGGFGIFFFIAGIYATRKILPKWAQTTQPSIDEKLGLAATPATLAQLPAMSAILPFLLLIMVAVRLPLPNPSPVFGLALLLLILMLGVARKFLMDWLPAIGLGCVLALEHAWHFQHFQIEHAGLALAWYVGFYLVFAIFPFLFRKDFLQRAVQWAVAALAGPLHFYLVHQLVARAFPNQMMGLLPALFALPAVASLMVILRQTSRDNPVRITQLAWFGGVALFFITLIFPMQFDRQWITIGWALEGAALLWLFHRVPHNGLRLTGIGLLVISFCRLALNPAIFSYHVRSATPIFNWYLYACGVVAACLFVGAKLLHRPRHMALGSNIPPILYGMGTVLTFLLMNIEIADFFSPPSQTLAFEFGGNLGREMTYTIAWALFALILVIVGIAKQLRAARYAGLGLLAITLLKLFFHDLAHLAQLYRIGALISVAIIAILASFFYQKFFATHPNPERAGSDETPAI